MDPKKFVDPGIDGFDQRGGLFERIGCASIILFVLVSGLLIAESWLMFARPEFSGKVTRTEITSKRNWETCNVWVVGSEKPMSLPKRVYNQIKVGDSIKKALGAFFLSQGEKSHFLLSYWHLMLIIYPISGFLFWRFPQTTFGNLLNNLYLASPHITTLVLMILLAIPLFLGFYE